MRTQRKESEGRKNSWREIIAETSIQEGMGRNNMEVQLIWRKRAWRKSANILCFVRSVLLFKERQNDMNCSHNNISVAKWLRETSK